MLTFTGKETPFSFTCRKFFTHCNFGEDINLKHIKISPDAKTVQILKIFFFFFYFQDASIGKFLILLCCRVRNLKFATYLKFATCENTYKINELW